jgi:hypothetical protein
MLLLVDLVYADSPIVMETAGTEIAPGYSESFESFQCLTVSESLNSDVYVTETSKVKTIGGRCI